MLNNKHKLSKSEEALEVVYAYQVIHVTELAIIVFWNPKSGSLDIYVCNICMYVQTVVRLLMIFKPGALLFFEIVFAELR